MKILKTLGLLKMAGFLFVLALLGMGCSKFGSSSIKISSWGDPKENEILQGLVADFNASHPNTKVELQRVPWGEYNTKLLTQVAGGIAPDVIFVSTDNIADLYPRGILEPLDEYIHADNFALGDFYPSVIDRFTIGGHVYGIPRDVSPVCVVYFNKKAFDDAKLSYPTDDWNFTEFLADAKALTRRDADGHTSQWGFADDWGMVEPFVYCAGGRWVDNPQKPNQYAFNSPAFISGLQFRADLILKHKVMPGPSNVTAMGGMGSSDMFVNGTCAMFLSGIWKTPAFRDIQKFDWDVAMFPKGTTGQRGYQDGGSGYGILKSSKNKKGAWEFVRFIAGAEGQKKMSGLGLSQPSLMSVAASNVFLDGKKPLNKKMLLKAVQYGVYEPMATNWKEIRDGFITPTFDPIWSGKITGAEAVSLLADKLKTKPLIVNLKEAGK